MSFAYHDSMDFMNKKYYKIAFFVAVFSILALALLPNGGGVDTNLGDKANHFIAFFTLSLLLNRATSTTHARIRNALSLLAFGAAIEILQSFTQYREPSLLDVVADGVGILIFQGLLSLYRVLKKRY